MKKIYRTIIQVEILSEEPYEPNSLDQIQYDIDEGDCSGSINAKVSNEEVSGEDAVKLIESQGSDPEFFGMDSDGGIRILR